MSRIHTYIAGFLCLLCLFGCGGGDKVKAPTNENGEIGLSEPEQPERPQPPLIPPGTERWRVETVGEAKVFPIVREDGTIYVGTSAGYVYAISPEGKERWFANMGESIGEVLSLILDGEDRIYLVGSGRYSGNSYLYALDAGTYGKEMWHALVATKRFGPRPILIGSDGTVYAGAYGFSPEGVERWHREGVIVLGLDTRAGEDVIYAGGTGRMGLGDTLYAFTSDGRELWHQVCNPRTPVTIAAGGALYIGTVSSEAIAGFGLSGIVQALDPEDGISKWSVEFRGWIFAGPYLNEYGTIYMGTARSVIAIGPDGTELWSFDAGDGVESFVLDSEGILYFGAGRRLYAVWSDDGSEVWSLETEGNVGGIALGAEGMLYFGSKWYVCAVSR